MTETVRPDDTSGDLLARLAEGGAGLLVATLDGIEAGDARGARAAGRRRLVRPQDPRRRRPDRLDRAGRRRSTAGSAPARRRPGAWTSLDGERFKIGPVRIERQRRAARRRASSQVDQAARCSSAPAHDAGPARRRAGRSARSRWPRPTGPAACGSSPGPGSTPMADPARGAVARRPAALRAAAGAATRVDAARLAAYDVLTAVRERGRLRQPGAAGAAPLAAASPSATPRSPPSSASGTIRRQGTYDAVLAACVDRPLGQGRPGRCSTRCGSAPTSCSACGCPPTPRSAPPSTWCAPRSATGRPASSTRCCARSPSTTSTAWVRRVAPDPAADPTGFAVGRPLAPALGRRRAAPRRSGRDAGRARRPARRRQRAAAGDPGRPPRTGRPSRSWSRPGGGRDAVSPYAVHLAGRRPGSVPGRRRRAAPASRTRAPSSSPLALAAAPRRGPRRALARPLRRPRRQGRAAGARWPALGAPACSPSELQPHRAALVAGGTRRGRPGCSAWSRPTAPARRGGRSRSTGCSSTRRAPGSARCGDGRSRAGGAARGRRATWSPLQRGLLLAALRRGPPGGVVAYVTCSPVLAETSGVVSTVLAERDDACLEDAAPLFADVPDAGRVDGAAERCSCGRTGRAPTRCSSPCCAGPAESPQAVDSGRPGRTSPARSCY